VSLTNEAARAHVALRTTVDDTHGGWATTTVYRADRVG